MQRKSSHVQDIDVSALLGLLALELNAAGQLELLSPAPDWALAIYPALSRGFANVVLAEEYSFLSNFMIDCESLWRSEEDCSITSAPWIETGCDSIDYPLGARGVSANGRNFLFIEKQEGEYVARRTIIQKARENYLLQQDLELELAQRKRLELELIQARDAAEQANAEKTELISTISHELRTPVSSILGFTQLALMDEEHPLSDDQESNLNMINDSGDYLVKLIDELLLGVGGSARPKEMVLRTLDPRDIVAECIELIQILAADKEVSLIHEACGNISILANSEKLKQVFINLLSNAVKYSDNGSHVYITESFYSTELGDYYKFEVKDAGIGIPEDKADRVFTRYSRLGQETTGTAGHGIGLAHTKQIVETMSGTIGFESEKAIGSRFWIVFDAVGLNQSFV